MATKFTRKFLVVVIYLFILILVDHVDDVRERYSTLLSLKNNLKDATKRKIWRFEKSMAYELCIFVSFKHCEAQGYGDPLDHKLIVLI